MDAELLGFGLEAYPKPCSVQGFMLEDIWRVYGFGFHSGAIVFQA